MRFIIGILIGVGLTYILLDVFRIPYVKTSKAVKTLSSRQKSQTSTVDIWLENVAEYLAKKIKINEFQRIELEENLRTAQIDLTPEQFRANSIVKAALVGLAAVPMLFFIPIVSPAFLIAAFFVYRSENSKIVKRIKAKREKIEYELPRFVSTIEKTLKHSRDVLYMVESYSKNAGEEFKEELMITVADMKSGNLETAITHLEARVGSPMMSDVCRGLVSILNGDDAIMYFAALRAKFTDFQRQQLRRKAAKVPNKVRKLSIALLVCFMLTYVVVIISQIITSMSTLFA